MYSFYKAFLFPVKDPIMSVDTSGDIFSDSPEKAVRSILERMTLDIVAIPNINITIGDETRPVDVLDSKKPPFMDSLLILRVNANNDNDVIESTTLKLADMDELDFSFSMKDLKSGYTSALQEYSIVSLNASYKTKEMVKQTKLSFVLSISGEHSMYFPDEIVYPAK